MARTYEIRKNEVEKKLIQYFEQHCFNDTALTVSITKIALDIEEKKDGVFRCIKSLEKRGLLEVIATVGKIKSYRWLGSHNITASFLEQKERDYLAAFNDLINLYKEKINSLEEQLAWYKKQQDETEYQVISTQKLPGGIVAIYRKEEVNEQKYHIDKNGNVLSNNEQEYYTALK